MVILGSAWRLGRAISFSDDANKTHVEEPKGPTMQLIRKARGDQGKSPSHEASGMDKMGRLWWWWCSGEAKTSRVSTPRVRK